MSNAGKNFPEIQIRNVKNWLRGKHSFVNPKTYKIISMNIFSGLTEETIGKP